MISIRQLTLGLATLYFFLLFASLLAGRWFWFYPAEIERQQLTQRQEVLSLQGIFDVQLESLKSRVLQLVVINNISTIKAAENISDWPAKLKQLQLNAAIVTDTNFDIQNIHRPEANNNHVLDLELQQWLKKLVDSQAYFSDSVETDIIRIGDHSYNLIITALNSQDSNQQGWIIFLQRITERTFNLINKLSLLKVKNITFAENDVTSIPYFHQTSMELTQTQQRCLNSKDNVQSICVEFTHSNKVPTFLNSKLISVNLLMLLVPLALYYFILVLFTKPINIAIDLLKDNHKKGMLEELVITAPIEVTELVELRDIYNETVRIANHNKKELEKISNTDRLTNIANRRAFDLLFEKTWNLACRHQRSIALCIIDIDFFKPYNDNYGHVQGDKVLHAVAQALSNCAKRADEIVARYGGEEFVILAYIEDEEQLELFSESIQNAILKLALPHKYSNVNDQITVSSGITWLKNTGEWLTNYTKEEWLNSSDEALYEAKKNGRQQNVIKIVSEEQQFKV